MCSPSDYHKVDFRKRNETKTQWTKKKEKKKTSSRKGILIVLEAKVHLDILLLE